MTKKIIYGTETGTVEEYSQCLVLVIPDDFPYDDLELLHKEEIEKLEYEDITTWQHVLSVLPVILAKANVPQEQATSILAAVIVGMMEEVK